MHDAYYSIGITRIRDGAVLMDYRDEHIDMWRIGSSYIRNKFGIYRSLGRRTIGSHAGWAKSVVEEPSQSG